MARSFLYRYRKFLWLTAGVLGIALLVVLGVVGSWVLVLDRTVVQQFEGRRWTLPARVYAAPLELYASLPLPMSELERELQRLQYRRVDKIERSGSYRINGDRVEVSLREAHFADESRPAQTLTITADSKGIESLRDASNKDLPVVRLEPLLIGSIFPIHGEDRIVLAPEDVPAILPAALKAVEDRKFDTHHGIDVTGILRAIWRNVRAGQVEQGGSTLTQQLVRSYFLNQNRTFSRKIHEVIMAVSLDAHFTKADLMNAYINEIFLGQDGGRAIHGFGLASQFYFGKPLQELDLAEIATLVAVVRGPSYYDPRRKPDKCLARRNRVLKEMADQGVIKPAEAEAAQKKPLGVTKRPSGAYFPAYLDFVRRTLRRDYKNEDLTEAGLRVYTSLDPRAQEAAENALERELARLDRVKKQSGDAKLEGAVVVTSPQNGEVIAIVGSRNVGYDGFNRALDARRQMGSLIKPFVYLTALETGRYTAATVVPDEPVAIPLPGGKEWRPENFEKEGPGESGSYGSVTLVRALSESLNLATIGVGEEVGMAKVAETLQRFGLDRAPEQVPSMFIGTVAVTPLEAAQLYNGLANGGFHSNLRAVTAVIGADGTALKAFPLDVKPVATPEVVYQLDRMLEQVVEHGTGRAARAELPSDLVVAGKTGTSSEYRDSWFAGFSGSELAVVWVGYDDDHPTGFTGASGALQVWSRIMASLRETSWDAPMPESLAQAWIDYSTGERITQGCTAGDPVPVAVPTGTTLPVKSGCSGMDAVVQRVGEWLRHLVH
jgi:penicillin-binding protein 1B